MTTLGQRVRVGFSHMNYFHSPYPRRRDWMVRRRIDRAIADVKEPGANAWRRWIHWGVVEPVIVQPRLRMRDVTEQRVEDYARDERRGWSEYDYLVDACAAAAIEPHVVLGGAYHFALAAFDHAPPRRGRSH